MVKWLGLHAFIAKGPGSIPDLGTNIPQATQCSQNTNACSSLHSPRSKFAGICILARIPHNSDTDGHLKNMGFYGDIMPLIVLKNNNETDFIGKY